MLRVIRGVQVAAVASQLWVVSTIMASAASPSFNCTKASTDIDTAICQNADLAALDQKVADAFTSVSTLANLSDRHRYLVDERHWLKQRNVSCRDHDAVDMHACLRASYESRLITFGALKDDEVTGATEVTFDGNTLQRAFPHDPKDGPSAFNHDLASEGSSDRVTSCSMMMEVPLTRIETGVGGRCEVRRRDGMTSHVLICDDTGVGRFKVISEGPKLASKHDLAQFTADFCTGG